MNWKDIGIRAAKTAVQVFLAALPANALLSTSLDVFQMAGLAGLSAGVAVIYNALLNWSSTR